MGHVPMENRMGQDTPGTSPLRTMGMHHGLRGEKSGRAHGNGNRVGRGWNTNTKGNAAMISAKNRAGPSIPSKDGIETAKSLAS